MERDGRKKNPNVSVLYTHMPHITECTHRSAKMPVSKEGRKEGRKFVHLMCFLFEIQSTLAVVQVHNNNVLPFLFL